jgi:3-oxoacyl-[acyl-carrier-protein] synthase II
VGYGATSDAVHITSVDQGGVARALRLALRRGGVQPAEVGYINAHATSTPAGDPVETAAIREVFGGRGAAPPVSASKSQFGHLLGAAGAIEAIISVLAMQHDLLPATINLSEPDPACELDYVPGTPRPARVDTVMSNSFGFGGHNVSLLFRRFGG